MAVTPKPIKYDTISSGTARAPGLLRSADWKRWTDRTNPATPTTPGTMSAADFAKLAAMYQGFPSCRVYHNANQSIATATITVLAYNSEVDDPNGYHDTVTNNGKLVVPNGLGGLYLIGLTAQWNATAGGGRRIFAIRLNGTTVIGQWEGQPNGTATFPGATVTTRWRLGAGDNVETYAYQDSGGAVLVLGAADYSPEFWLVRLSD